MVVICHSAAYHHRPESLHTGQLIVRSLKVKCAIHPSYLPMYSGNWLRVVTACQR
ncbi:MAG: hypothetical protein RM049_36575 [Nostoc sp. DedQUE04]|uniref:hypothetical protein n=1 Tax=Nostoc sp. DedQUE04 TaxID=3075390 RepID=UPI002AD22E61|nr:hypothetical protein [Nostoc sp. DedQUE04]MDZ8140748.1 hypothetical protein [Nostoc sp. DedQUE04]